MAGFQKGHHKHGGRKAGTPNKRTVVRQAAEREAAQRLANDILREYRRLAFASIDRFVTWDQHHIRIKPSAEMTPHDVACIQEIIEHTTQFTRTVRIKLHPKLAALDSLVEYLKTTELEARVAALEAALQPRRNGHGA
jgi:phage terminase small subunit